MHKSEGDTDVVRLPWTCGNGQRVNTTSCKCECINAKETLCPGTGTCISNACPEGAVLQTSGQSCECQCGNPNKEIVGAQCVCKTNITCAGTGEVIDPDTCACGCPPATIRCGGNCVAECLEGFVLKNCECVREVTCLDVCTDGCCDQGNCVGGNSNTACGSGGTTCTDCTQGANKVCVNGVCRQCAANADCTGANEQCVNNVCQVVVTPVTCPTGRCSGGPSPVTCGTGCRCEGSGSGSRCVRA